MQMIIVLTQPSSYYKFTFALEHRAKKFSGLRDQQVILIRTLAFFNRAAAPFCRKKAYMGRRLCLVESSAGRSSSQELGWPFVISSVEVSLAPHCAHLSRQIECGALRRHIRSCVDCRRRPRDQFEVH